VILILPGLGFGVVEAAEGPLAADEVVDIEALFGVGGVVVEVALLGELLEIGETFAGEDEGFGVEAGFEVIHGRDGLACDRGGAGGFPGVTAVGFYLTKSRHGCSGESELRSDAQGRALCHFEDRAAAWGNRGVDGGK
jgi:hypothetical protein